MATSVWFIIRLPYKENSEDVKTEPDGNKNLEKSQGVGDAESSEDQNVKEVKSENTDKKIDKTPDQNEAGVSNGNNETDQTTDDVETLAEVLRNELRSLDVEGDTWTITNDKKFHQVTFLERSGERLETILNKLEFIGIGKTAKSSVSILQTSVHIPSQENEALAENKNSNFESTDNAGETILLIANDHDNTESAKDQFKKSIKSRLTVQQVAASVECQTVLTFDFVMFTLLASFIAADGLAEDNAVVMVAGILVSPLMGPIIGGTFGAFIKNKNLRNKGLTTGLCGLSISIGVGFVFGIICGPLGVNGASWDSTKGIWPTDEMTTRGMTRSLWVGVCIALPSGAGVALSVLGGNIRSLVGVAISASLLTPAVNSGMLFASAIIAAAKPPELDNNKFKISTSKCEAFKDNSYMPTYSCDMGTEAAIMAVISLVLTFINIICILLTASIVLKIKEVTPKASSSNATQAFWTRDIKVAREAHKTTKGDNAKNLLKEWKKIQSLSKPESQDSLRENFELVSLVEEVERTEEFEAVVRRAPRGEQQLYKVSKNLKRLVSENDVRDPTTSEKQLKNLNFYYSTIHHSKVRHPHVSKIFSANQEPESKPEREFKPSTSSSI